MNIIYNLFFEVVIMYLKDAGDEIRLGKAIIDIN
jgi:hypothetical protein